MKQVKKKKRIHWLTADCGCVVWKIEGMETYEIDEFPNCPLHYKKKCKHKWVMRGMDDKTWKKVCAICHKPYTR